MTLPLWAAVYRAPLAAAYPVDASLWLEAESGALASMSPDWFKRRIAAGKIPAIRLGRSVRLREADLARLVESGRIPAREEDGR